MGVPFLAWFFSMQLSISKREFLIKLDFLVQVTGALERKEGLMAQVRQMSEEAGSGKHMDENGGHSDTFQQAYAKAVLELRKVNILCPMMLL